MATRPRSVEETSVSKLFDAAGEALEEGLIPVDIFNDPRMHELELERVFGRCWVYVGHVSEIPEPGDYVLRYVGEDKFILNRSEDGEINLLLNACRHRGASVCQAEKGNTSHFRCPYHAWIYKNNGDWAGAPSRTRAYKKLDASKWGLLAAPHVDTIQGMIFASLDPDAPNLRDYLGDFAWYLDTYLGLDPQGTSVMGEPHRWQVPANWKSGAENFCGDAYHVPVLHRSGEEIGSIPNIQNIVEEEFHVIPNEETGHNMILGNVAGGPPRPPWGELNLPPEVIEKLDFDQLDAIQRDAVERFVPIVWTIFPNLSYIGAPGSSDPSKKMPAAFMAFRQWQPKGPDGMEIWNWPLTWNSAPEEFKRASYDGGVHFFSSSGIVEQDDTIAWAGAPEVGRSKFARANGMKFNLQMGRDGMSDHDVDETWQAPGTAYKSVFGEVSQVLFYKRWLEEVSKS